MSRRGLIIIILLGLAMGFYGLSRWPAPAPPASPPAPDQDDRSFGPTLAPDENGLAPGVPIIETPDLQPTLGTNPVFQAAKNSEVGQYLTDLHGRALYLFARDSAGESTCQKQCADTWLPYVAPASAPGDPALPDNVTLVTREDGNLQFAINGLPLYFYLEDRSAGDAKGNGVFGFGGLWFLAKP